jgi:hypothetical protein
MMQFSSPPPQAVCGKPSEREDRRWGVFRPPAAGYYSGRLIEINLC